MYILYFLVLSLIVSCSGTEADSAAETESVFCDYYVNSTGEDSNTGSSWLTAFLTLPGAYVAVTKAKSSERVNICVAQGTYTAARPSPGAVYLKISNLNREVAFYGGFIGTESETGKRPSTIVNSVIDGAATNHVIQIECTTEESCSGAAILDGFTVENGQATTPVSSETGKVFGGGGIWIGKGAIAQLNNLLFTDNQVNLKPASAVIGAGGAIYNAGRVDIKNSTLNANKTYLESDPICSADKTSIGGAIYNVGTLNGNHLTLANNYSCSLGGAIYNDSGAVLKLTATGLSGNYTYSGAAGIYNLGTETLSKLTAEDQVIQMGPSGIQSLIYNGTNAATVLMDSSLHNNQVSAIYNDGNVQIKNSNFASNYNSYSSGGAIYNSNSGTLNLSDSNMFTLNATIFKGGAIYNFGTLEMSGSNTFVTNAATQQGGAIYNSGSLKISGSNLFHRNQGTSGGAIYNEGTFTLHGATFTTNSASENGGAVYSSKNGILEIHSKFLNNYAQGIGGGVYNEGSITEVTDSIFEENTSTLKIQGSGIYNSGTIEKISKTSFLNNIGSSIYNASAASITSIEDSFCSESTRDGCIENFGTITRISGLNFISNSGSGILNSGTIDSLSGSVFNGNASGIISSGTVTKASKLTFIANSENGILNTGTMTLSDSILSGHAVSTISNQIGADLTLKSIVLRGNTGSGIYNNAKLSGSYLTLQQNNGSGIQNDTKGTLTLTDSSLIGNNATTAYSGGGMYNLGKATLDRVIFNANQAGSGAAIGAANSANTTITNSAFFSNLASPGNGGAIQNSHATLSVTNCTFWGNNASGGGQGGSLSNESGAQSTIVNSILWFSSSSQINSSGAGSTVNASYSDIEGGFSGSGNINKDPLFVQAASANYKLSTSSPASGAGNYLERKVGGTYLDGSSYGTSAINMGAYGNKL